MDIEGFEEEDDGKPKTPAPVRKTVLLKGYAVDMRPPRLYVYTQEYTYHSPIFTSVVGWPDSVEMGQILIIKLITYFLHRIYNCTIHFFPHLHQF